MAVSLNFGANEKGKVKQFLKGFEKKATKTAYEEFRCKVGKSIVTLYHTGKITIQGKDEEKVKEVLLEAFKTKGELVLGIDETGRGERTGPMVIAGVLGNSEDFREFRDSKKIKAASLKKKAELVSKKAISIATVSLNAEVLDSLRRKGYTLDEVEASFINSLAQFFQAKIKRLKVKADGKRLKGAAKEIEFIVKGDDLEPVIGAASIIAKQCRTESKDKKERQTWKKKQSA